MKPIEIFATLLILIASAIIIRGNHLIGAIEFDDDTAQVKSLLLDLSSRVQHLEKKNDDLTIQVQQFIESSEDHFDLLEENIDQIEKHINQSEESMIVFSAYVKTDHYYGNGDGINGFDEFLANYGNTFYLASGIFTTPKSGMYEFSFAMCHDWKYSAIIQVWKNDVNGLAFYSGSETSTSNHDTLSATWLITLKKSDTIQLKAVGPSGTNIISCGSFSNCVFNGKYIRSI